MTKIKKQKWLEALLEIEGLVYEEVSRLQKQKDFKTADLLRKSLKIIKEGYWMRNNPDDLSNQLLGKIKFWLKGEIQSVKHNPLYEDDDSRESGILEGRLECADGLLNQIKKWEKELYG